MSGAPIPKPPKRGPKPRKPIKRCKPIARKSRPAPVRRSESGRAKSAADREWSRAVRAKGPCAALGRWGHIACFGRIDPAHIQSRRYLATRHDVSNGLPLCRFIHDWFGRHPEEFEAFVRSRIGDAEYERLRLKAIQGPKLHQTPSRPSIQPSQLDEARAGIEGRGSVMAHIDDVIEVMNRASKAEAEVQSLRETQAVLVEALKESMEIVAGHRCCDPDLSLIAMVDAALARAEASKGEAA